jgi:hypothetical protein
VLIYTTRNSWQLGRCRAGQLRFGFVAVLVGHIVCQLKNISKHHATPAGPPSTANSLLRGQLKVC